MSITGAVFEWFEAILPDIIDAALNINYLLEKEHAVSIETVPCNPVLKKYVDGGELRQYEFVLALREGYNDCVEENIGTAEFFEKLSELIEEKSDEGDLPHLEKYEAREMRCVSHGYAISNTQRSARYQMQCKFIYYKKGC